MEWKQHAYRVGSHVEEWDSLPAAADDLGMFIADARKRIEPWLSAVFQAEHLNVLLGNGFSLGVASVAGVSGTYMSKATFASKFDSAIDTNAEASAKTMGRGAANIEDQLRVALALLDGLTILNAGDASALRSSIDTQLKQLVESVLKTESNIAAGKDDTKRRNAERMLQSFLLSFASRAASRERLHIFTTNYDRLVERGCDLAGLRTIDRFVGALNPLFRSTRVEVDVHYNPPGIRGEPRFLEGVVRLTKLHGSLDWFFNKAERRIERKGIPFGAPTTHTDLPKDPIDKVLIYPNAAKDMETTHYPYAELFRDFAAAVCRANAVLVSYGYGFGDDHINRVILDMLTVPSTHLVIIAFGVDSRLKAFCEKTRDAQVSLLLGSHFADLTTIVEHYLPKPALDYITGRLTELLKDRPKPDPTTGDGSTV